MTDTLLVALFGAALFLAVIAVLECMDRRNRR